MSVSAQNRFAQTKYGTFFYNSKDTYIGRALELYGEAHEHEIDLLRQLCPPGGYVFDVGANIGDHTVPLTMHVGPTGFVFAFEPQRILFHNLCANVALNSLQNVECVFAAVGAEHGTVLIPDIDYSRENNYGGISIDGFVHGRPVRRVCLDDFIELRRTDLVKIDVEGMEADVLNGARGFIAKFRPVLYVENDRIERSRALIELLWELGYRLFWHVTPLFNERNFRANPENVFPNLVTTNMLCIAREVAFEVTGPSFTEILDSAFHPFA